MKVLSFSLIAAVLLGSCTGDKPPVEPPPEPEVIKVRLDMAGEKLPSKVVGIPNDLTAVQISYKEPGDKNYKPYAWGLFDDMGESIEIDFLGGFIYMVEASVVVEGTHIIASYANNGGYRLPFVVTGMGLGTAVTNKMLANVDNCFTALSAGNSVVMEGKTYKTYQRPNTDRYWGQVVDFDPQKSTSIVLELKRVVFGLQYTAVNLTDGELTITPKYAPATVLTPTNSSSPVTIYTMQGNNLSDPSIWATDGYQEQVDLAIIWKRDDGTKVTLPSNTITAQRKSMYPIKINLQASSSGGGLSIVREDATLLEKPEIEIER